MPELIASIRYKTINEQYIIDILWAIDREAVDSNTLPLLIDKLQSNDPKVRASATRALGKVGFMSQEVVLKIVKKLEDEDYQVREFAAISLGIIADNFKFTTDELLTIVVKGLISTSNDKYLNVSYASEKALEVIKDRIQNNRSIEDNSHKTKHCVPQYKTNEYLEKSNQYLNQLREKGAENSLPELFLILQDQDNDNKLRCFALKRIENINKSIYETQDFINVLTTILKDKRENLNLRLYAMTTIEKMDFEHSNIMLKKHKNIISYMQNLYIESKFSSDGATSQSATSSVKSKFSGDGAISQTATSSVKSKFSGDGAISQSATSSVKSASVRFTQKNRPKACQINLARLFIKWKCF